jgi:metacaspase-1
MTNRALCVGINNYPVAGADLMGCVNDARAWAELLRERFDFPHSNVNILTDRRATKAAIMDRLKALLAGASSGDVVVFTNSSHGSYIPDREDDEPDGYDETMCPYDVEDRQITDDDLRELFAGLSGGVRLTVISDSCHSGSVTRAFLDEIIPGLRFKDKRRVRFLNPALLRRTRLVVDPRRTHPTGRFGALESDQRHLLLSGCRDDEYSFDARIAGKFHGAMTYHAIKAIKAARYRITPAALVKELNRKLPAAGYDQHPQLSGPAAARRRPLFT